LLFGDETKKGLRLYRFEFEDDAVLRADGTNESNESIMVHVERGQFLLELLDGSVIANPPIGEVLDYDGPTCEARCLLEATREATQTATLDPGSTMFLDWCFFYDLSLTAHDSGSALEVAVVVPEDETEFSWLGPSTGGTPEAGGASVRAAPDTYRGGACGRGM
jgi:hypothetical protein